MPHSTVSVKPEEAPKIIFVRQQFSAFGGAELVLDRTLKALSARGHKVGMLARSWHDRENIEFIRCNPPKLARTLREVIFARAACKTLARYPDSLVQSQEKIPCCDIYQTDDGVHAAFRVARKQRANAFGRAALTLSPYHRNKLALERQLFTSSRLKAVIAVSQMVVGEITQYYDFPRERIHHIPYGIELDRFSPDARRFRSEVRNKLGVSMDQPVALFVGSGFDRKGLDVAIRAVAQSRKGAELWVVGRDRWPGRFTALAEKAGLSDRYRYFGPQADPLPWFGAADVLLLPSTYESFGIVVIEAMACGLPSVVSKNCGAREIVEKFNPSLVVDGLGIEKMAEAVDSAIALSSDTGTAAATRQIAESYSVNTMIERLLDLYGKVSASREL